MFDLGILDMNWIDTALVLSGYQKVCSIPIWPLGKWFHGTNGYSIEETSVPSGASTPDIGNKFLKFYWKFGWCKLAKQGKTLVSTKS